MLLGLGLLAWPQSRERVYFGTYTRSTSQGIYQAIFDLKSQKLGPVTLAAATANPSYLVLSPDGRFLYAVNELTQFDGQPTGAISAFAVDASTGALHLLNQVPSGGTLPCYLSFDRTGRYLFVANYGTGSVGVFALQKDGRIGPRTFLDQHQGHSLNPRRQAGPHAHFAQVSPDNRYLLSVDLGLDKILVSRFDPAQGTLQPASPTFAGVTPGTGPRHFVFADHGAQLYLVSELGSQLFAFNYRGGRLSQFQALSTKPPDYAGNNTGSEVALAPHGRFVYVSNRGADTIAQFAVDAQAHTLHLVANVSTQGRGPRMFQLDPTGDYLWVGNQDSNNVVVFRRQRSTGQLQPIGLNLALAMPVCIQFQLLPDSQEGLP